MEIVVIVLLAVVVLGAVGGAVAAGRRRRRGVELEPPPGRRPLGPSDRTTATTPSQPPDQPQTRPSVEQVPPPHPPPAGPAERRAGDASTAPEEPVVDVREGAEVRPSEPAPAAEAEPVAETPSEAEPEPVVRPRFRDRLSKARSLLAGYVGSVLSRTSIDDETWEDLEEALIRADVGVNLTQEVLDELRGRVKQEGITEPEALVEALKESLKSRLAEGDRRLSFEQGVPNVWLFVGVNGVGKTTTIGKLGKRARAEGLDVVMAAGDTFRAAAAEQLGMWSDRVGADLVRGAEGADPGSVVFDAVERAAAKGADLVLADTAGRLHTKVNLMEELKKVRRVADREPGRVTEVLLVLDATTGQNGLVQAKQFTEAVQVTGVVLTKLDGTAKGGIALAVHQELGLPIKLVGLGEGPDDLVDFDPDQFVEAIFS